ncbi:DNA repair protein RecO [Vagococcus elongatus]|uniref:DNA repair protein RecO n=1 Tax=Vagococcus elongatus TaxID=180344 RepID=A0A430AMA0_9ENTE|nr:DNA repair protein RecO [Vagococcus elongatus]RSU09027.1 DNA repair protein RecO [Vagococcus elongatus]
MQSNETKGLILFARNHREKDKLVKIFTEKYGKRMFFMRNAMRKNNPLTVATQPFTEAVYVGKINEKGLSFLNDAKEVTNFKNIQQDIFISAYATYLLNLVDVAIDDSIYDPALYGFTRNLLQLMDEGKDPQILTNILEIQILERFGLDFDWLHCRICGKTQGKFDFSSAYHGVLCEEHFYKDPRRYHGSPRAIHFIRMFSSITLEQINTISVSDQTKKELREMIDALYEEFVGVSLKSKQFIDKMASWEDILRTPKEQDNSNSQTDGEHSFEDSEKNYDDSDKQNPPLLDDRED